MRKIVVGIDLSQPAEHALAHAVAIARRREAEVVMVMVDVVVDTIPAVDASVAIVAGHYGRVLAARLAQDRTELAALRERWSGQGAVLSTLVVDGHPDERLAATAAELKAELVVVGSHGRTGPRRWFLGSVAEHVVRLAEQPVLVARGDAPADGYQRVVIGTDFTAGAERAIEHAVPMLGATARVELVHGWLGPRVFPEVGTEPYAAIRTSIETVLAAAGRRLTETLRAQGKGDVRVTARLLEESPSHALANVAADVGADLVVVGSHGRRGVRRWLLGSVAEVTVRHAPCSVLVSR